MMPQRFTIALVVCWVLSAAQVGATPGGLEDFVLVASGGPTSADVEVEVNGEWAATLGEDPALFTRVGDLLKEGQNTLTVRLVEPDSPRSPSDSLRLTIQRTETQGRRRSAVEWPVAELVVPAGVDPGTPCEETVRFWVGKPPHADVELKKKYWLFITGPPVGLRVTVSVNDAVVYEAASGTRFVDVSQYAVKGKNTAVFESRPTCLVEKTGRDDFLTFSIGEAELDTDVVRQTAPPQVYVEYRRKKDQKEETIKRNFRAR